MERPLGVAVGSGVGVSGIGVGAEANGDPQPVMPAETSKHEIADSIVRFIRFISKFPFSPECTHVDSILVSRHYSVVATLSIACPGS